MGRIQVRRAADRFSTVTQGRTTWHSFSFDRHYDPSNVSMGVLRCHNEDLIDPGHGYRPHPHRDVEVVTWVLEGGLAHEDSTGHRGVITPGQVQRLSAGSGVVHAEVNAAVAEEPVHFVQMWVTPDELGSPPGYASAEVHLAPGQWVTLASGMRSYAAAAAVPMRSRRAALHVVRVAATRGVELPEAPGLHLFVARGRVELEEAGALEQGDAVRLTDSGGRRVSASSDAELMLWELHELR